MRRLPVELWIHVFGYLQNESRKSLKIIIQVCRCFRILGTPLLFSTLRVSSGDPTYNLIRISTTPRLAQHVKKIKFGGPGATPYLWRFDTHDLDNVRTLCCPLWSCNKPYRTKQDVERDFYKFIHQRPEHAAVYFKPLYWQQGHLAYLLYLLLDNGRGLDLGVFPKLQVIETDKAIFRSGESFLSTKFLSGRSMEFVELNSIDPSSWDLHYESWLFRALQAGVNVATISLHRIQEILMSHAHGYGPLKAVKHLLIDISASTWTDNKEWEDLQGCSMIVAPWLSRMSGLETLTLIQNPALEPAIDIMRELKLLESPLIHTVNLVHITTNERNLFDFMNHHIGPLRALRVHEPVVNEVMWTYTRNIVEQMVWCFGALEMSNAYKPGNLSREEWDEWLMIRQVVPSRSYLPPRSWMSVW